MSVSESYLFNQQLPDNETYIMLNDILTICNCVAFGFSYLIIYLSPPSKESYYYKLLLHCQAVFMFLFSIVWSLLLKYIIHLNYNFFYCEGYCNVIGLTCANGYVLLCLLLGSYAFCIVCSYFFRLYLVVDHTHYLRTPYLFPIICFILEFVFGFSTAISFCIGYSEFTLNGLPFNFSKQQLDYLSVRTVASYTLQSFKQIFHPVYLVFLLLIVFTMILFATYEIVRTIHKKQNFISAGTSSHHLKVLKILTIQVLSFALLTCCVPIVMLSSLIFYIHAFLIHGFALLLGANSSAQSVLTICLNPVFRKTAITLIGRVPKTTLTNAHKIG